MVGFSGESGKSNFSASRMSIKFCSAPESISAQQEKVVLWVTIVTFSNNRGVVELKVLPTRIPRLTGGLTRLGALDSLRCDAPVPHSTGSPQPENGPPFPPVRAKSGRSASAQAAEERESGEPQLRAEAGTTAAPREPRDATPIGKVWTGVPLPSPADNYRFCERG